MYEDDKIYQTQAHKQCEFMEKKHNELTTKLSDARLFAEKKQVRVLKPRLHRLLLQTKTI